MFQQTSALNVMAMAVLLIAVLFFARAIAHRLLANLTRVLVRVARMGSYALAKLAQALAVQNRESLIAQSIEWRERRLEQSFKKFDCALARELAGFAGDQQQLREHIAILEEDYEQSGAAPMPSPEWVQAVDAVTRLPGNAAPEILFKEVSSIAKAQQKEALKEYRWSVGLRHRILNGLQPRWRECHQSLQRIEAKMEHLQQRAAQIDLDIERFQGLQNVDPQGQENSINGQLARSMWLRFMVSVVGVAVVLMAAATSFWIIKMPLEAVAPGSVQGVSLVNLAAALMLAVNCCAGAIICELTGLTRFFPLLQGGSINARRHLLRGAIAGTALLAMTQALLAYSYAESALTLSTLMSASANAASADSVLAVVNAKVLIVAYTLLGLLLPPALILASIPLESFLRSLPLVVGKCLEYACRVFATLLAVTATPLRAATPLLCTLYDLLIFLPLWLQAFLRDRRAASKSSPTAVNEANHQMPQGLRSANEPRHAA